MNAPTKLPADGGLPPQLAELLPKLAPEQRSVVLKAVAVMRSGPIPDADEFCRYPEHAQEKIIGWVDAQQEHRMALEVQQSNRSENRADRGQMIAALVAFSGIAAAVALVILDKPWPVSLGIAALGIGGPSAATAFSRALAYFASKGQPASPEPKSQPQKVPRRARR